MVALIRLYKGVKMFTVFKEPNGQWSMRRTLAFIFSVVAVVASVLMVINQSDFKLALAIICPLLITVLLLLFFTTWSDVARVVKVAKGVDLQIPISQQSTVEFHKSEFPPCY